MLKTAREILTHEQIDQAIESKRADIEKCAMEILGSIPKEYKNLGKIWYKGLHYGFFFLFMIPVAMYKNKCRKFKIWMRENGNFNKMYMTAFEGIKDIKFVKSEHESTTNDLLTYKVTDIPKHARISRSTDTMNFNILGSYNARMRSGEAYWYKDGGMGSNAHPVATKPLFGASTSRSTVSKKERLTQTTGFIEIRTEGLLPKFTYSLFSKNALFQKGDEMEDPLFNKKFQFESNDRVQSRVMYTPLTLERTVAHKENVKLKWWAIEKTADKIIIRFEPKKWDDASVVIKPKHINPKKFTEYSIKEMKKSFNLFYNLTGFVLLQILL